MKKLLTMVIFLMNLAYTESSWSWTQRAVLPLQQCEQHSPYGFATTKSQLIPICRRAYLSAYDAAAKIPKYVSYTLLPTNALGCVERTNAFVADASVVNGPTPDDYVGTGYDKGHAAPDGDMSWDQQVEYESFLMTNMYPQAGSLNRGIWKLLETSIRGWTVQLNNSFTIYVGAVYDNNDKKIGKNIVVPHGFYKIVVNNTTKEVAGWAFPHVAPYPNLGNDLTKFRLPISQIEAASDVNFAFPENAVELQPGKEWPVNFGALTAAKRTICGKIK
jgi:endonuclease G